MCLEDEEKGALAPMVGVPSFSLGAYLAEACKAIRTTLPPKAWVEAVILEARPTRAGISLELIEPFADDRNDARLRCVLWTKTRAAIEKETGLPLDTDALKGSQARLLLKPGFHPRFHLEGEVLGLDPIMIQSLVAKRLEAIRRTLREENLYGAQHQLSGPIDVVSVAVIHPDRSAGWADIAGELERLEQKGILTSASFPVPFEGPRAAGGIADALAQIERLDARPDLVLIVRGGGAAAGLAGLANLALARAICRCPIPVVTGIGHANDHTVLDELAWRCADTPSKALNVVKDILRRRAQSAAADHSAIVEGMQRLLMTTLRPLLDASRTALVEVAEQFLSREAARVREAGHSVERRVIAFRSEIDSMQKDLDRTAENLLATVPSVPRMAQRNASALYCGLLTSVRARLPSTERLELSARRTNGIIIAVIERQAAALWTARCTLEEAARRRLNDEGFRLKALAATLEALDVNATLRRGFVLPVDRTRQIIRSVEHARRADRLDLMFTDGSVACRPVPH